MPQEVLQEIDANFIGLNSRLDPSNLQPGFAQEAYNVRLQRGTAQPRKGCARLTSSSITSEYMVGSGTFVNTAGQDNIVLVYKDGIQLWNTELSTGNLGPKIPFPSEVINGTTYYRGIAQDGIVDVVQALDKLYIFRGQETEKRYGVDGTNTGAALDLVYPAAAIGQTINVVATWINSSASNHPTYAIGDEVTIFNVTDNQHSFLNGTYIVQAVNGTSFTFSLTSKIAQNQSTHVYGCVVKVKPPLIWDGASTITVAEQSSIIDNVQGGTALANGSVPPSDFGFYFQNRIVCKVTDHMLMVSDIFDDLFDFQINNFIINQGGNDSIVGILPWIDSQFLVFMRRSIWVAYVETTAYGSNTPPGANSSVTVVTTQIGCLSRRSIVAAGQFVFFLSGKGVHVLTPQLDLKLLGNTQPLSEPVDDFFENVNFKAAAKSVSSYYDNRFFIALPTKDSAGNYVDRPNAILVYNTLNQNWECVDTYPAGLYIDNYAVCQYGNQRRQFILTNFWGTGNYGGIFLTEEYPNADITGCGDQFDVNSGIPVLPFTLPATLREEYPYLFAIDARIRSREYTFGNTNQKRFNSGEYQFNNSTGDTVWVTARTHDPDLEETVMEYAFTGSSTQDSTLRPRIALRGAAIDVEVQFKAGRPALKSAALYAIVANRKMVSQE